MLVTRLETAEPLLDIEWVVATETELDPPYDVFIHNDDVTSMDFVIAVLQQVFNLDMPDALSVMLVAHNNGEAKVATLPLEDAKYKVGQAHSLARQVQYPLRFTIEPAQ